LKQMEVLNIDLKLNTYVDAAQLKAEGFDEVVISSGVAPRVPNMPGVDHEKVVTYQQVLDKGMTLGKRVAVMGAGGIGYDMCEYLTQEGPALTLNKELWMKEWGVDESNSTAGGLQPMDIEKSPREVFMLQRKTTSFGKGLNKTSGWVHRAVVKMKGVETIGGVSYDKVDDAGLHITITTGEGDKATTESRILDVDHVVLCAGQVSVNKLHSELDADMGKTFNLHLVGGAEFAGELDAKRCIKLSSELAASL
jgi:2,4-dienoyl-CoA reductase (NADPH2)